MDALVSLLPVVVGGLLAIAGGAGTQWYLHCLKVEDEKRSKRAAKFEELMVGLYEYDHWLEQMRDYRAIGISGEPKAVSPYSKVRSICSLYFPQFGENLSQLKDAGDDYERWMTQAGLERLREGKPAFDSFDDVYRKYASQQHDVLKTLEAFAQSELQ